MFGPGGGPGGMPPGIWDAIYNSHQDPINTGGAVNNGLPFNPGQTSPLDPSNPAAQMPPGFAAGAVGIEPYGPVPFPGPPPGGITLDQLMQQMVIDPRTGKQAYAGGMPGMELMKYILGLTNYLNSK